MPQNPSGSDAPEVQKMPILSGFSAGGAEGGRTPDLLIANKELVGPTPMCAINAAVALASNDEKDQHETRTLWLG